MKLRIVKLDQTIFKGWENNQSTKFLRKIGEVTQIHNLYQAIQLRLTEPVTGERVIHWYHANDLEKIQKVKHKEEMFDINNLVVGV